MELDRDRLRAILEASHSYYGSHAPETRIDDRLAPSASDFIASQFSPDMRVLDVGGGSGATLLENGHRFASGLGINDDPAHVRLAEEALRRSARDNVEFRLLDFPEDGHELEAESFDFVFSERGPIGYDSYGIQAALRVLKDDGLLFCEMIGNLHHQEVAAVFGPRGLAGKPLAGFRATPSRRITGLTGIIYYVIRFNNLLLRRIALSRKRRRWENRGFRPSF